MQVSEERRASALMRANGRRNGRLTFVWEWFRSVVIALGLFFMVRAFFVEAFKIPTGSMENTLLVGDFLLVNKAVYGAELPVLHTRLPGFSEPRRSDVVVFFPPHDPNRNYVKRLVGVPGDTLEMREKVLYVNGVPQFEPYTQHVDRFSEPADTRMLWQRDYLVGGKRDWKDYDPTRDSWGPIIVPIGKYFALGDNRDNSEDSRYWGFLDARAIRGRPMFVYYSFARSSMQAFSWLTDVRWGRIGEPIH
jgi:signal peptidase I